MRFLNTAALALLSVSIGSAEIIKSCTEPNTIALTFDDGPFKYTMDLLDRLQSKGVHATFFINGYNYWQDLDTDPEKQAILKRAHADGHQIASHTWSHEIPSNIEDIEPMMKKLDDVIEKAVGYRPKYFRPPRGECGQECEDEFERLGYRIIEWDTDTNDWNLKNGVEYRVSEAKEFLTERWDEERNNYLVLMHDVYDSTVNQIVPWILENAPFDKYKFVTVAECLGDQKETHGIESSQNKNDTDTTDRTVISKVPIENTPGDSFNLNSNTTAPSAKSDAQSISYHFTIGFILLTYILYTLL